MNRRNTLIGAIITIGFLIKLSLIFAPTDFLVGNLIPDDSFYYFKTAQHIVDGNGSTFDGVNPANGYHPLWMVLITPLFSIFGTEVGNFDAIRASLVLSVLLDVGTILLLLAIIRRFTKDFLIQVSAVFFWVLNPFIVYEVLSGLETSLSLFLILSSLYILLNLREKNTNHYIALGVAGGLMMLARLDNLFYFLAILIYLFFNSTEKYKRIFQVGMSATVVVLPWLAWNVTQFGGILTSSSAAFTMYQHGLIVQDHGPSILQKIKASIYMAEHGFQTVLRQTGAPVLMLLLSGFGLASVVGKAKDARQIMRDILKSKELYFFGAWILLFILHTVIRVGYRTWYFVSFNIFLVLFLSFAFAKIFDGFESNFKWKKILALSVIGVFFVCSSYVSWSQNLENRERAQLEMKAMAEWGNDNLPAGTIIGSFNSGVQGYFSNHRVVNLDGLINQNAYEAMRERNLWSYLESQGIEYVSDFDIYMTYRYKQYLGVDDPFKYLKLVHSISFGDHGRSGGRAGIHLSRLLERDIQKTP